MSDPAEIRLEGPTLELEKIGFRYDSDWVIRAVSLTVQQSEFLGIIGPNGSGKTTLLKVMNGILQPQEGRVQLSGLDLKCMDKRALARIVAAVPQDTSVIFPFSVREVVLMGRYPHLGFLAFEGENDSEIADAAMRMTGMIALGDRGIHELSGGERQRVLIARALAQQPEIILLDEPTAFQDIKHQVDFFHLIRDLNRKQGLTVIAVTHDVNLASSYCDRLVLLKRGAIHVVGRPDQVITEQNLLDVYETDALVDRHPISGRPRVTLRDE
jgi:iron complex transport system ATP-binding protein